MIIFSSFSLVIHKNVNYLLNRHSSAWSSATDHAGTKQQFIIAYVIEIGQLNVCARNQKEREKVIGPVFTLSCLDPCLSDSFCSLLFTGLSCYR